MHKRLAGMTDGSFFKKPGWVDGEKPAGHTRQARVPHRGACARSSIQNTNDYRDGSANLRVCHGGPLLELALATAVTAWHCNVTPPVRSAAALVRTCYAPMMTSDVHCGAPPFYG